MSTATDAVEVVVKTGYDILFMLAEATAYARFPFLKLPVINTIFKYMLHAILDPAYRESNLFAVFTAIKIETAYERAGYTEARDELKKAITPPDGGKPNADQIKKARDEFMERLYRLGRLRP